MDNEAHYYKPDNMFPDCDHFSGGKSWYSDICACFMSDGTFELCRYLMDEDDSSKDNWNCSNKLSVVAWMGL